MLELEKKLYNEYFQEHRTKVTTYLFWINAIFLLLSCTWNFLFLVFQLAYSRANFPALLGCLGILFLLGIVNHFVKIPSKINQYFMLAYCAGLITVLYFESGYSESWSFFLLLPLLGGLYGEKRILFYYSFLGLGILSYLSFASPTSLYTPDSIDISNRILVYIILATLSFFVLKTLHIIYMKQVNLVLQSMQITIEEVVNSFIVAVEAKDLYTFGHSERVSMYAVALAKYLPECSKECLEKLRLTGLLHDIGKINIPEAILSKEGKLTDEEYEVIKTHPVVGARMVERIERLQELKDGVLYHHERWDGNGYPTKRKGEDIPLEARILAIADAFDAMTSNRSYRKGLTVDEAFQALEEGKGTQFDPQLIDVLQNVKGEFRNIYQKANDPIKEFESLTDLF
ncbi:HD-GYP domain-containing protein [Metabacillus sediminilitoris]|uniref:HD-GYP domain-containing protein n=1 Tax=Metabacillus sediminilitoris TaxID=2567941 RepID=A0A4S4C188_9BACI|nr:HD-GYP domain-containing protein [Metabacillus sediminilitoris]QGQ48230.1 HD domain-containing protein [Metabacillus sediminilitoris]THF81411.1 HD-GYP domain-containing protein [Metabacillus sediminilitoris]